jgi:hypothetical protein
MKNHPLTAVGLSGSMLEETGSLSPFVVEFFTVQVFGFKCMAYRDRDGKWRRAFDNIELPGFVRVLE